MLFSNVSQTISNYSKMEEMSVQAKRAQCKDNPKPVQAQQQLRLHELRAEKYNVLVRLLTPGCRTIILLVDNQSRLKLLPAFHKAVWPYRYCTFCLIIWDDFILMNTKIQISLSECLK